MIKKLLVAVIALVLVSGSVTAFAYWDNLTETQSETITLGQGVSITVGVNALPPAGKVLVPTTVPTRNNDVTQVVYVYDVNLDTTLGTDLPFNVTASNVQIGGTTTHAGLVNIDIAKSATTINSGVVTVTVTVTLTEPTDEAAYNAIKAQDITFDLTFAAE